MKTIIFLLAVTIAVVAGAYVHERDIVNKCKLNGDPGGASWTGEIICKEMKGE